MSSLWFWQTRWGAARLVLLCVAECPVCGTVQDCVERHSEINRDQESSSQGIPQEGCSAEHAGLSP